MTQPASARGGPAGRRLARGTSEPAPPCIQPSTASSSTSALPKGPPRRSPAAPSRPARRPRREPLCPRRSAPPRAGVADGIRAAPRRGACHQAQARQTGGSTSRAPGVTSTTLIPCPAARRCRRPRCARSLRACRRERTGAGRAPDAPPSATGRIGRPVSPPRGAPRAGRLLVEQPHRAVSFQTDLLAEGLQRIAVQVDDARDLLDGVPDGRREDLGVSSGLAGSVTVLSPSEGSCAYPDYSRAPPDPGPEPCLARSTAEAGHVCVPARRSPILPQRLGPRPLRSPLA